jgi:Subtilisin-like serine proteases
MLKGIRFLSILLFALVFFQLCGFENYNSKALAEVGQAFFSGPINIRTLVVSDKSVQITWDRPADDIEISGYVIYRDGADIGKVTDVCFTDTGLNPETQYTYFVKAYDINNNFSEKSEVIIITTQKSNDNKSEESLEPNLGQQVDIDIKNSENAIDDADKPYKTDRFIIKYKGNNDRIEFKSIFGEKSIKIKKFKSNKRNNIELIKLEDKVKPEEMVNQLKNTKGYENIEYIQPDYQVIGYSNDTYYPEQWGVLPKQPETMGGTYVQPAWNYSKGEGALVAVIDTGIDITHEDLSENIWINNNEISGNGIDDDGNGLIDDINGWNFFSDSNIVHDSGSISDELHGTEIAGVIAAVGNNGKGISGVAPKAKILPIKVFENGIAYTSDIIDAIDYAAEMGAKIVNCSWGCSEYNTALKEAIEESNMLFICASGNSHSNNDIYPVYPASFGSNNIISVSSVDKDGKLSNFSNYGVNSVDLAAPGENIYSTVPNNVYGNCSGTSISAAFVSGEAALLNGNDINDIRNRIINSSDMLSSLSQVVNNSREINALNAITDIVNNEVIDTGNSINGISDGNTNPVNMSLLTNGTWTTSSERMTYAREGLAAAMYDNDIFAAGGKNTQGYISYLDQYDHWADLWYPDENMPTARTGAVAATVNGKIYVIGGYDGSYLNTVEEYNPTTDSWTTKTSMLTNRGFSAAAVVSGKIYVFGGCNSGGNLSSAEVYDPSTNAWTQLTGMSASRSYLAAAAINSKIYVVGGENGQNLNTLEEYDTVTNTWTTKAVMPTARKSLGAASLNGKVFAIGGYTTTCINTVEVYDPVSNTWSTDTGLSTARKLFGVVSTSNKIYVLGGSSSDTTYLNTVEIYQSSGSTTDDFGNDSASAADLTIDTNLNGNINYSNDVDYFRIIAPTDGEYIIKTTGTSNTVGYLYDSSNTQLATDEDSGDGNNFKIVYNLTSANTYYVKVKFPSNSYPSTGPYIIHWYKKLSIPQNITLTPVGTSISLSWGSVSSATGYDIEVDGNVIDNGLNTTYQHTGLASNIAHAYRVRAKNGTILSDWSDKIFGDTLGSVWTFRANMPSIRGYHGVTCIGEKIYVVGGYDGQNSYNTLFVYNTSTNTWESKSNMSGSRYKLGAAVANDKLYAIGGYTSTYSNKVEMYDPISDAWTTKQNMPTSRGNLSVVSYNNKIYAIGGNGSYSYYRNVEVYDPSTNTWTSKLNMPTARSSAGITVYNNKIYVIGGYNGSSYLNTVEVYDPATNTWTTKQGMPTARKEAAAITINNKILVIGGYNGSYLNTVEEYDPISNTWTIKDNIPMQQAAFGTEIINNKVFVIGGYNPTHLYLNTVMSYIGLIQELIQGSVQIYSNTVDTYYDIVLKMQNVSEPEQKRYSINYDTEFLDLIDICAPTPNIDLTTGLIPGTNITVESISTTTGNFTFINNPNIIEGFTYTGVIIIRFKSKNTGQSSVAFTVEDLQPY